MHKRAQEIVAAFGLQGHPEGGFFAEVFRSDSAVSPSGERGARSALTVIYFLLEKGGFSRWHKVVSDEVWHFCEGGPLELFSAPPGGGVAQRVLLGTLADGCEPIHVVQAGWWQAARPLGTYALASCTVGPGFDFADFTILSDLPKHERPSIRPSHLLEELA